MADDADPGSESEGEQLELFADPELLAGSYANFARISHTPYEFTVDFYRVDFGSDGPVTNGVLVQRMNMAPLFVAQFKDALEANWQKFMDKTMPKEVGDSDADAEAG